MDTASIIDLGKVDDIIREYGGDKSWLVMVLQDVQQAYNYLPREALARVAERLGLSSSHVFRVATFYSSFSLEARGRHIVHVCDGTACHLRGSMSLLDVISNELGIAPGQTTSDRVFTLETVACLGACALAPAMMVDAKHYGKLTPEKLRATLTSFRKMAKADER
jgi:NADH-quinone oxidoreductase subunit E